MADEDKASKTEEPTQRKLDDAHKKGQVVKSQEVGNWAMIAASTLAVAIFAGPIMVNMAEGLRGFMENAHDIRVDPETLHMVLKTLAVDIVKLLAAPLGILLVAAIGSNMIQHRPVLTLEKLKPKFEKISPIKGLKEKFSLKTIAEFVKNIGKVAVVAFAVALVVWPERHILTQVMTLNLIQLLAVVEDLALADVGGGAVGDDPDRPGRLRLSALGEYQRFAHVHPGPARRKQGHRRRSDDQAPDSSDSYGARPHQNDGGRCPMPLWW